MGTDFYVELSYRSGFMRLRTNIIERFSRHDQALDKLRDLKAGSYYLRTYWDGKLFDENVFVSDGKGNAFIDTEDGRMKITSYFNHANRYVYMKAFIANHYMQKDRSYHEHILNDYILNHKEA